MNYPTMWGLQGNYKVQKASVKQRLELIETAEKWRDAEYVIVMIEV